MNNDIFTLGIDIGSTTSKAVVLKNGSIVISKDLIPFGTGTEGPEKVYQSVLNKAKISENVLSNVIVTGYGRFTFKHAKQQISEVSCHAAGMHFLMPSVRTVIDIGGQDAKALSVNKDGKLIDFVMNDKCAAGTGRFLEVMSRVLNIPIDKLGEISSRAHRPVTISSICTVFAESEVISQLASGANIEDVVAGVHRSIAKKTASLALRIQLKDNIAVSGGVALNPGIIQELSVALNRPVYTVKDAQLAGAYGAAVLGFERL